MSSDILPNGGQSSALDSDLACSALLLFTAAICVFLAWAVQPRMCVVETLFQVKAVPPSLLLDANSKFDEREFNVLRHTQIALLKSDFVLEAALRGPGIALLPMIKSQPNPIAWMRANIQVEFLQDSEVLLIRLRSTEGSKADACKLLDAIAMAYQNEVVFTADQERLVSRDALAKAVNKLGQELKSKTEELDQRAEAAPLKSSETKFKQLEIDALVDMWRKLNTELLEMDIEAESPKRIIQIQPAVAIHE